MKFTTNLERYFFAKICEKNADEMWKFSLEKRDKSEKGSQDYTYWDNSFKRSLYKSNLWAKVAEHFEDAAFKGIPRKLETNLGMNGMIPRKEA